MAHEQQSVSRISVKKEHVDYFQVDFDLFKLSIIIAGSWGSIENWLEPKTKPPSENLASPNL